VDAVARLDWPTVQYNCHDSGFAHKFAVIVAIEDLLEQAGLKAVDLVARVAQTSDFDGRLRTNA
jgi:hypothetical protein